MIKLLPRKSLPKLLIVALVLTGSPAFAVNKDMVQLESEITDLQAAVARLQQSNDERMGVLQHLIEQSADSVNKMSITVETLQKQMSAQSEAQGTKVDQVSGQVQSLNDSVDEIKARLNHLEKTMQDAQNQLQSINASLQNISPSAAGTAPTLPSTAAPMPEAAPPAASPAPIVRKGKPSAGVPMESDATAPAPAAPVAVAPAPAGAANMPPVGDIYKVAYSDYVANKFPLAFSEFSDVVRNYPEENLAGNAYYYMGEVEYMHGKFANAVRDYDHVLEHFPDNVKVPVAHLHKAQALLALKQNDAGVRELRALIQRFPTSPEATLARSRLNGMGVPIVPKTPPLATKG